MVYFDEQVVRQLYDAFNHRNFDVVIKLYADDIHLHCPPEPSFRLQQPARSIRVLE
jgi:hypothetical protein